MDSAALHYFLGCSLGTGRCGSRELAFCHEHAIGAHFRKSTGSCQRFRKYQHLGLEKESGSTLSQSAKPCPC